MATIPAATPPRKAPKAYYCWLHDRHGILTYYDSEYVFMDSETDELTVVEPIDFPWIMVNGEVGLAECQKMVDDLHHGAVMIACTRRQEVQ